MNFGIGCVVTGTITYSFEYTFDDPNDPYSDTFPTPWVTTDISSESANKTGSIPQPIKAFRVTVEAGTGEVKVQVLQAGQGGYL